jgi:uncharacterized protein YdhG (YjbR/CyaY superfamily)
MSMTDEKPAFTSIDEYIAQFAEDEQQVLKQLRQTIRDAAPDIEEKIAYGMPTFRQHGMNVIYFSVAKKHYGVYPGGMVPADLTEALSPYHASKGTLQFPKGQPIPYDLITQLVQVRLEQARDKEASKKAKKKK